MDARVTVVYLRCYNLQKQRKGTIAPVVNGRVFAIPAPYHRHKSPDLDLNGILLEILIGVHIISNTLLDHIRRLLAEFLNPVIIHLLIRLGLVFLTRALAYLHAHHDGRNV